MPMQQVSSPTKNGFAWYAGCNSNHAVVAWKGTQNHLLESLGLWSWTL